MSSAGRPAARIAVIVPCYNDGTTVRETVESVKTTEPVELVIVDDGSSDPHTHQVLAELESEGERVVRHESNRGLVEARMTALAATSAPLVLPLDSDDCLVAGALVAMADLLDAHPEAVACCGDYEEFGDSPELVRTVPRELDPFRVAYTNEYPITSMYRRELLEAVNGWRFNGSKELASYEDWDLWMKIAGRGAQIVYLPDQLVYRRRLHAGQRVRLLDLGKGQHRQIYAQLRAAHPNLFGRLREHRRKSTLSAPRKLLYPLIYGGRTRFRFERHVKRLLDRLGVWTLRR